MMRDECWNEPLSLEAEKIIPIQSSTDSQYLRNDRNRGTAHGSKGLSLVATMKGGSSLSPMGKRGCGEVRRPKAEDRKKAEGRSPKKSQTFRLHLRQALNHNKGLC